MMRGGVMTIVMVMLISSLGFKTTRSENAVEELITEDVTVTVWEEISTPTTRSPSDETTSEENVTLVAGLTQTISSPNYPSHYPNNARYDWYITAPRDYHVLVKFLDFYLQDGYDYLRIGNGDSPISPGSDQLVSLTGYSIPSDIRLNTPTCWMYFTSDSSVQEKGFQLELNLIDTTTEENVTLTFGQTQTIVSPNYPANYPNFVLHNWYITAPLDYHVLVHFVDFYLEVDFDYLRLGTGDSPWSSGSVQQASLTGNSTPPDIRMNAPLSWMEFTSDYAIQYRGFKLQLRLIQSITEEDVTIYDGPTQAISSPNYPSPYPANARYDWYITAPLDYSVTLHFLYIYMQSGYDYLRIGSGDSPWSPDSVDRASLTGYSAPSDIILFTPKSWMYFTSDGYNQYTGFLLHLSFINVTTESVTLIPGMTPNISSPNYPANYPNNAFYEWYITAPPDYHTIVRFLDFYLESYDDYLRIGTGDSITSPDSVQVASLTGYYIPSDIRLDTNTSWMYFTSDSSGQMRGFQLELILINSTTAMDVTLVRGLTQTIASPNYPEYYPNNAYYDWYITAPLDCHVLFHFLNFNLEYNDDYLRIGTGYSQTSPGSVRWASLTGTSTQPDIRVDSPEVWMQFTSDESGPYFGFQLELSIVSTTTEENVTLAEGPTELITSPNYPTRYPNDAHYYWYITAPPDPLVVVHFLSFYTEYGFDYLQIGTGDSPASANSVQVASLTGYATLSDMSDIRLDTPTSWMNFTSNDYRGYSGFRLQLIIITSATEENVTLAAEELPQNISSPNYPSNYPSNVLCDWFINAPPDYHVLVHFLDFYLQSDYLRIGIGDSPTSPDSNDLVLLSGTSMPPDIRLNTPTSWIYFISDGLYQYRGFQLQLRLIHSTTEEDVNLAVGQTQNISSPNYPVDYPNNARYHWFISAPSGYHFLYLFLDFYLEDGNDYLAIGIGDSPWSTNGVEWVLLTGSSIPSYMRLNTPTSWIYFTSDSSVQEKGFLLELSLASRTTEENVPLDFGQTQTISSPNYPANYPRYADDNWYITVPPDYQVLVHFMDFYVEQSYDYLQIGTGDSPTSSNSVLVASLTGYSIPSDIRLDTPTSWMNFVSDSSVDMRGFQLELSLMDTTREPNTIDNSTPQTTTNAITTMTTEHPTPSPSYPPSFEEENVTLVVGMTQNISSPNYPADYPNNAVYHWYITAPLNYYVLFHFVEFYLEYGNDYLVIGTGDSPTSSDSVQVASLTGYSIPSDIRLDTPTSWMNFTSDNSFQEKGFLLEFSLISLTTVSTPTTAHLTTTQELISTIGDWTTPEKTTAYETTVEGPAPTTFGRIPSEVRNASAYVVDKNTVIVSYEVPANPAGVIVLYVISYSGMREGLDGDTGSAETQETQISFTNLFPGLSYIFTIIAVNDRELQSNPVETNAVVMPQEEPSPVQPNYPYEENTEVSHVSPNSITVQLPENLFSHDNGVLTTVSVIISEAENATAMAITGLSYEHARNVGGGGAWPPYISVEKMDYPYPPQYDGARQQIVNSKTTTGLIEIGTESCSENENEYCNGPLKEETQYYYSFRAFNDVGSVSSGPFGPVKTVKNSLVLYIAVAVSVSVILLIIVIVIGITCKRRKSYTNLDQGQGQQNPAFEEEHIELSKRINRKSGSSMHKKNLSKPILLSGYEKKYGRLKTDAEYKFAEEFEELRSIGKDNDTVAASSEKNRAKNRYTNILPYDQSRVKLGAMNDEPDTDYINASYIPGYTSPREFISCQGPLPGTVDDMIRLIWEKRSTIVVMLTHLVEGGKDKCHQYWPAEKGTTATYGSVEVLFSAEVKLEHWIIRTLILLKDGMKRKVTQFQFTSWPDHGVPDSTWIILDFVRDVRKHIQRQSLGKPVVVHCSAGVGRTGVYIALDRLIQHMRDNDFVDIFGAVCEMRMQRNYMVQTENQYIFIHDCVMDILMNSEDPEISAGVELV